jgi:hypothetical protein
MRTKRSETRRETRGELPTRRCRFCRGLFSWCLLRCWHPDAGPWVLRSILNFTGPGGRFPKLGELRDDAEADVLAFRSFPKEHWRQNSSTNLLKRINKENKRRTNVVGIFPNDGAITRLVRVLVNSQQDEWWVTRKYMSQEDLQKVLNPASEQRTLSAEGNG